MKDLPPNPPVWKPPAERWFDRHECTGDSRVETGRTLTAMWLTLHDRMRLPLPTKTRTFTAIELAMLSSLTKRLGADMVMTMWRSACNHVKRDEEPDKAFLNLLKARGIKDE